MRALGGERHALARFWNENRRLTDGAWSGAGGRRALSGVEAASVGGGGRTAGGPGGSELGSGSRCGEAVPTAPPLLYPPPLQLNACGTAGPRPLGTSWLGQCGCTALFRQCLQRTWWAWPSGSWPLARGATFPSRPTPSRPGLRPSLPAQRHPGSCPTPEVTWPLRAHRSHTFLSSGASPSPSSTPTEPTQTASPSGGPPCPCGQAFPPGPPPGAPQAGGPGALPRRCGRSSLLAGRAWAARPCPGPNLSPLLT